MATFTQAYAEALASAPVTRIIVDTLEVFHPLFVTRSGGLTAARFVRDNFPFRGKIEATATVEADVVARFEPLMFNFALPPSSADELPMISVQIDNVSNILSRWVDLAARDSRGVKVTYRPYLFYPETDLIQADEVRIAGTSVGAARYCEMSPPLRMSVSGIQLDRKLVSFSARPLDLINRKFPSQVYIKSRFPTLSA